MSLTDEMNEINSDGYEKEYVKCHKKDPICLGEYRDCNACVNCKSLNECLKEVDEISDIKKKIIETVEPNKMLRLSKNEYYINIAKAVSARSTCLKRRYGAIIVKNDQIIATGYNGSPRGNVNCCDTGKCERMQIESNSGKYDECFSVHAEQNALLSAARSEMIGSELYLWGEEFVNNEWIEIYNCSPCPVCSRMIKNAGIKSVITKYKLWGQ